MKKKLFYCFALLSVVFLSSCNSGFDDGGYSNIYPGLKIYESAEYSNGLASDGLAVMTRFAILQAEMEANDLQFELNSDDAPDWSELGLFKFGNIKDINKCYFLFGSDSTQTVVLKMTEQDRTYTIEYGHGTEKFVCGALDSNYRSGTYEISTGGLSLNETSQSNPWTLTTKSDKIIALASNSSGLGEVNCLEMHVKLWSDSSAGGTYKFTYNTTFEIADDKSATPYSWDTVGAPGELEIKDYKSLLIEDTLDTYWGFSFDCDGYTIHGDHLSYTTSEPLLYNYTKYAGARFGGAVKAEIHNLESDQFPSTEVEVKFDEKGSMTFTYNDFVYTPR